MDAYGFRGNGGALRPEFCEALDLVINTFSERVGCQVAALRHFISCHSITERSFDKGRQPSATMKQQEALKVLRDSVVSKPELLPMKV